MKKQLYPLIAATLLAFSLPSGASAQLERGVRKPSSAPSTQPSNANQFVGGLEKPNKPTQATFQMNADVPVYDQIHTPIRWYAIENEKNTKYWEGVNSNRIWVVLDEGRNINENEIRNFLEEYHLTKVVSESKIKEHVNYWIFQFDNASPEKVVAAAKAAREIDGIQFLEPSVIYTTMATPNDPLYTYQWGPYVTSFETAWDQSTGGDSWNVVCIIDDACDWNHEDLTDQVWYGWDYAQDDGDISPDDPENHKHGTHTTGTVAATINNGIGVAGMVNDTVFFAKVGNADGTLSDEGIVNAYYAVGDIARITAVNMSFGGGSPSDVNEQGCNYAWNHGKILCASSGNDGTGTIIYPAAYDACMAVGAIGTDGQQMILASYSQYGNEQEICAPGGSMEAGYGIVSTIPQNQYDAMEGTSMAAPHVTGLAGLIKHVNMNLSNADIRNIINATATDFGNPGWDQTYGYGMINAAAAIQAAINGSVGVAEVNNTEVLRIYPNPATNNILIDKKVDFQKGTFEILDITGKVVKTVKNSDLKLTNINISELPQGVYLLHMTSEIGATTSRFVKM